MKFIGCVEMDYEKPEVKNIAPDLENLCEMGDRVQNQSITQQGLGFNSKLKADHCVSNYLV